MSQPARRPRRPARQVPRSVIELMRAADRARRQMVAALAPHDITLQQANVLIILRRAGEGGLPTLEVANQLVEQAPGITRLVNTLADKGYIRRKRCTTDGRQQLCSLTDKGSRLLDRVLPDLDASCVRIMQQFGAAELDAVTAVLTRIGVSSTQPEPERAI